MNKVEKVLKKWPEAGEIKSFKIIPAKKDKRIKEMARFINKVEMAHKATKNSKLRF